MSVYVDGLVQWGHEGSPRCFRSQKSCHMYADSLDELHAMADRIGMKRSWFQNNHRFPHYDLVPSRRAAAIKYGAVEHDRYDMVNFSRKTRGQEPIQRPAWAQKA